MTIPNEILNLNSDIACTVVGSQLYKQASETSDIDLKIICLDDIYDLLPVRDKPEKRSKVGKYEITRITLTDLIQGLKIGKINEVEIITSNIIPYNPNLVTTLRDIFIHNISDSQKLNLINNCIGVINNCNSRTIKGQNCKPISVLSKVNYIYRKCISPLESFPTLEEALNTLLTIKHSITTGLEQGSEATDNETLEFNKWKYTSLYLQIQKEQYGTIVKKIIENKI